MTSNTKRYKSEGEYLKSLPQSPFPQLQVMIKHPPDEEDFRRSLPKLDCGEALELLVNPKNGLPMFLQFPLPKQLLKLKELLDLNLPPERMEEEKKKPVEDQIDTIFQTLHDIKDEVMEGPFDEESFEDEMWKGLRIAVLPSKEKERMTVVESTDPSKVGEYYESPALYSVFLINESGRDISHIDYYATGFEGSDDEVVYLNRVYKIIDGLKNGTVLLLDKLDSGLLDFMLQHWLEIIWKDGGSDKFFFGIWKAYSLKEETIAYEPLLNGDAYHYELEKGDGLSEESKKLFAKSS